MCQNFKPIHHIFSLVSFDKPDTATDKISNRLYNFNTLTTSTHPEMSLFFVLLSLQTSDKFANFEFGVPCIASCYFDLNMEKPPFIALDARD